MKELTYDDSDADDSEKRVHIYMDDSDDCFDDGMVKGDTGISVRKREGKMARRPR